MDAVKVIRSDLRRMGNLYRVFQQHNAQIIHGNVLDMFEHQNFEVLREAILEFTLDVENDVFKCGLKHILHYTIKTSANILKGTFLSKERDDLSATIDNFLAIYKLNKEEIFGDALYQLNKNRQVRLWKPVNLPLESDVQLLRNYMVNMIEKISSDEYLFWDPHVYVQLRDCCCLRLTLFNGRRDGEPARLLIEELNDAFNDEWIDKRSLEMLDTFEKKLTAHFKITYQSGKGTNHLVPILIPQDILTT